MFGSHCEDDTKVLSNVLFIVWVGFYESFLKDWANVVL